MERKLYSRNPSWLLRVWEWGKELLGTASHQALPGNRSLPQARPGRDCPPSALAPFPCWLFPTAATRGLPCAKNGKSCARLERWRGRLAQCPLCVPEHQTRRRPTTPPYPGGSIQSRTTFSSLTPRHGLEIGTPGSPAASFKPRERPEGWESKRGTQARHVVGAQ